MNISDAGLEFIKQHEGLRLSAYPDPASGGAPWTVGVGHTGPEVVRGYSVSTEQAMADLRSDCAVAEDCIAAHVNVELTQNQFDALVSFIFNLGCGSFKSSTLLRRINEGDFNAAYFEFSKWSKAAGKTMPGLVTRRAAEADLFETA